MADLWCPFAIRNEAPKHLWGNYRDDDGQWKYVLHTTESLTFRPNPNNYYGHSNYPHATISDRVYQHIPINRAARALVNKPGGAETNADRAVQVEIVWKAANIGLIPLDRLDLVRAFGAWMVSETGMPWQCNVRFMPAGNQSARMTATAWDNYAGICGHQHVPENSHTDPGQIDIAYLLGDPTPPPTPQPGGRDMLGPIIADKTGADSSQVINIDGTLYVIDQGETSAAFRAVPNVAFVEVGAVDYAQFKQAATQ